MVECHSDSLSCIAKPLQIASGNHKKGYTQKEQSSPFSGAGSFRTSLNINTVHIIEHIPPSLFTSLHLKRRPNSLLTSLRAASQHLAGALLHAHLALHLLHLLLLAEGQRPGDAEQKRTGADDPEGFAAEGEA